MSETNIERRDSVNVSVPTAALSATTSAVSTMPEDRESGRAVVPDSPSPRRTNAQTGPGLHRGISKAGALKASQRRSTRHPSEVLLQQPTLSSHTLIGFSTWRRHYRKSTLRTVRCSFIIIIVSTFLDTKESVDR
ncbi:uncharacterized protein LOC101857023 [Aplysia californica]|uniref:Uncharacterized protein LOC101857023 n=1 Tax=Aplysia californica TaxID=6500 RepID=A0ABM1A0G8_APLCA|nr:uncharacterized protein LOC101857023 [Aplysia californica]